MRKLTDVINTDIPSPDYPKGRIRNQNLGGGIPGTPIIEELYGDIVQFVQKLIIDSGITENDLPDNVSNGYQLIDALAGFVRNSDLVKYDKITHIDVAEDFAITGIGTGADLAAINETDIAYVDDGNDQLRTYRFDGFTFTLLGSALSLSPLTGVSMCLLDTDTVVIQNTTDSTIRVYSWSGTAWSQVGSSYSSSSNTVQMTKVDTNIIAIIDDNLNTLSCIEWNGSSFSTIGNALTITGLQVSMITTIDTNRIVFAASNPNEIRMYEWDGSDWSQVGNGKSGIPSSGYRTLLAHNTTDITFFENANDIYRNYRFDGTDWNELGVRTKGDSAGFRNNLAELKNFGVIIRIDPSNLALKLTSRISIL